MISSMQPLMQKIIADFQGCQDSGRTVEDEACGGVGLDQQYGGGKVRRRRWAFPTFDVVDHRLVP